MKNPLISFARAIYGNPATGASLSSSSSGPHAPNGPAASTNPSSSSQVAPATPFKGASSTSASAGSSNAKFPSGSQSSSSYRLSDSGGSLARTTSTGSPRGSHTYLSHHGHGHNHTSAFANQYPGAYIDDDLLHSTSLAGGPGAMSHLTTCPCFHAYSTAGGHPQFWGSAIKCNCATRLDFSQVLPTELALHVMGFLDPSSLAAVARCSTALHALATDQGVWRAMYRNNAKWRTSILARPGRLPNLPALVGAAGPATGALVHQNGMQSLPSMTLPSPPASPVKPSSASTGRAGVFETDSDGDAIMHDVTPTPSQPTSPSRNGVVSRASSPAPPALDWQFLYRNRTKLDANWASQESTQTRTFKGHADSVYCIQFDRDWLISGSRDQTVRIWSMATGQVLKTLTGHTGSVLCLQYDANMLVTGSSDATVMVWDLPSGTRRGTLAGHSAGVLDVAFDGEFIVSCSKDSTIKVWERKPAPKSSRTQAVASGNDAGYVLKHTLTGHRAAVNAIQLRGDILVSASGDYVLKMWNVRTGALIRNLEGHTRGIACVAYDGQIVVSGSNDQTIRIWDAATGQCIHVLQGHTDLVRTLALDTVRGYVVSGSYDQTVKVWKVPNHVMDIVERGRAKEAERAARARADKRKRNEEEKAAERTSRVERPGSLASMSSSSSSSSGASTPVHHGETATSSQPSLTHASSAGSVNSTGSASATGAAAASAAVPPAQVPQLPLARIPKSTAINTFDTTHSSWVFNVGISPTHIVSASQDQTIVVYEYTQGVDKRWII